MKPQFFVLVAGLTLLNACGVISKTSKVTVENGALGPNEFSAPPTSSKLASFDADYSEQSESYPLKNPDNQVYARRAQGAIQAAAGECGSRMLDAGQSIGVGGMLHSANCQYRLVLQPDGNLVVYQVNGRAIWWSMNNAPNQRGNLLVMQTDGNLVLYNSGVPTWHTNTWGHPVLPPYVSVFGNIARNPVAILEDNGDLAVWAPPGNNFSSGYRYRTLLYSNYNGRKAFSQGGYFKISNSCHYSNGRGRYCYALNVACGGAPEDAWNIGDEIYDGYCR